VGAGSDQDPIAFRGRGQGMVDRPARAAGILAEVAAHVVAVDRDEAVGVRRRSDQEQPEGCQRGEDTHRLASSYVQGTGRSSKRESMPLRSRADRVKLSVIS